MSQVAQQQGLPVGMEMRIWIQEAMTSSPGDDHEQSPQYKQRYSRTAVHSITLMTYFQLENENQSIEFDNSSNKEEKTDLYQLHFAKWQQ